MFFVLSCVDVAIILSNCKIIAHGTPKELINKLEKDNVIIVSVEQADQSIKIQDFKPVDGFNYAFVFGNEVDGVRDEFIKASKHVLEIPQEGTKHSLNVSVTAGVVLWDFYKKYGLDNS